MPFPSYLINDLFNSLSPGLIHNKIWVLHVKNNRCDKHVKRGGKKEKDRITAEGKNQRGLKENGNSTLVATGLREQTVLGSTHTSQ